MRTTTRVAVDRKTAMAEFERQDREGGNAVQLPSLTREALRRLEGQTPIMEWTSGFLTDDRSETLISEGMTLASREPF